ncbi:hypothetical protein DL96DRAFT_1693631 [Flagelloscypha sp. PMI_526]|nr:hypothetical protein DL96DRAFT_1693631 [Flagelloscypha sp. PMI_526]
MDEEDEFLYGSSEHAPPQDAPSNPPATVPPGQTVEMDDENGDGDDDEAESVQESDEDSDVEFIMEPTSRSVDFRQAKPPPRPHAHLTLNPKGSLQDNHPATTPSQSTFPQNTTPTTTTVVHPGPSAQAEPSLSTVPSFPPGSAPQPHEPEPQDLIDTSTLPPVTAPQSHPSIDPTIDGSIEGRSIIEVDLAALSDKPWRKPGSDLSDWFNYGFDEISWEAYCYRRRDVGDLSAVLKTSVLTFTNLPEEQIQQLPPEVRQMVMSGTSTMLSQNAAAAANGFPHSGMMDMGMMNNPMDIGMGMMMHPDAIQGGMASAIGPQTGELGVEGGEYVDPASQQIPNQFAGGSTPIPAGIEPATPNLATSGIGRGSGSATPSGPAPFANRPAPPANAPSGPSGRGARGGYIRGRGRGYIDTRPPPPQRPVSPLPANVPTGPRSQTKYKDKDRDAGYGGAGESLDYGGSKDRDSEERGRKRRGSPSYDERSTKRR